MLAEMNSQRQKFMKEFAMKKNLHDSQINEALKDKKSIPNIVSIPKQKRESDSDSQSLQDTVDSKRKSKKQKRS